MPLLGNVSLQLLWEGGSDGGSVTWRDISTPTTLAEFVSIDTNSLVAEFVSIDTNSLGKENFPVNC